MFCLYPHIRLPFLLVGLFSSIDCYHFPYFHEEKNRNLSSIVAIVVISNMIRREWKWFSMPNLIFISSQSFSPMPKLTLRTAMLLRTFPICMTIHPYERTISSLEAFLRKIDQHFLKFVNIKMKRAKFRVLMGFLFKYCNFRTRLQ